MRRFSRILVALLLVFGTAVTLALWQGGEMLRGVLETQLQAHLVPTLKLGAPLEWQLQPQPQIVMRDVSLTGTADEASGAVVLKLAELRVTLDGAGLTGGRLEIASVTIDGLDLALERDADGAWNAAGWLRPAADDAAPIAMVPVGRLSIENARVRMAGETRVAVADIKLNAGPLSPGARGQFTLGARVDAPSAAVVGLRVEAAGQFLVDLDHPVLEQLKLDGVGEIGGWSVTRATAQAERLELATATTELQASGLMLELAAQGEAGQIAAQATLAALSGSVTSWLGETLRVQARGEQASRVITATLQSDQVRLDDDGGVLPAMTLEAASSGVLPVARLQLSGAAQLDAGGDAQFVLTVREAHTAVPHPADASAALELAWSGRVAYDLASGSAAGEMAGSFDHSRFDGRWAYEPLTPTSIKVNATLDRLDLDRYLPPGKAGVASASPLDLALWRNWPVSADLRVGELRVQGFVSQQARVRLGDSATDGR